MALISKIKVEISGKEIEDFINVKIKQSIYGFNEFEVKCHFDTFQLDDTFVLEKTKKYIGSVMVITLDVISVSEPDKVDNIVFKGLITKIKGLRTGMSLSNIVTFKGKSPEILLNDLQGSRSFENKTIQQIVNEVFKPYPRDILKLKVNPKTKSKFEYTVQHEENSYSFIRRLAKRYGEWMYYNGSEFVFGEPGKEKTDLIIGEDLSDFDFNININPINFKLNFHDYFKDSVLEAEATKSAGKKQLNEPGILAHDKSVKNFSWQPKMFFNHLNVPKEDFAKQLKNVSELQENAQASRMSSVKGSSDNPLVRIGGKVNIKALKAKKTGKIDYGEYIITSVTHICDNTMNYKNKFTGVSAESTIPDYTDPGEFPTSTSQGAVVVDNKDPEKLGRIKVRFFWQDKNSSSPWIRCVNPYSAANRGFYFIPEIGDEVLVEYEGGDAEKPYVAGSLYNGKNKPDDEMPDSDNFIKGIITKSNLRIIFDDSKKVTTINTPGGNKIVLSDDEQSIVLSDQNSNTVELSPNGIVLDSPSDIKIKSKTKIFIQGDMGVETKSDTGEIKTEGMSIKISGSTTFVAEAGATAEMKAAAVSLKGDAQANISSGANTTIKGAVVMIN